jgi:protein-S-isoprenylcysteine O-methyltransferase Ste14
MNDMRGAKLIASAILVAAGALALSLWNLSQGVSIVIGLVLLAVGIPLMVIQWRSAKRELPGGLDDSPERSIDTGFKEAKDY